ncbi:MAG: RecX family transcriptional regulator [Thermoanaerobaculia bacterium]
MRGGERSDPGAAPGERPPALDRALRFLALRPHFRAEIESKLARAGYAAGEIEAALARLAELGYLDDAALARSEAERLRTRNDLGRLAVGARLKRKGAGSAAVAGALAGGGEEDELATARRATARWLRGRAGDGPALARHLARKGFAARVIVAVLRERNLRPDAAEEADGFPDP